LNEKIDDFYGQNRQLMVLKLWLNFPFWRVGYSPTLNGKTYSRTSFRCLGGLTYVGDIGDTTSDTCTVQCTVEVMNLVIFWPIFYCHLKRGM